MRTGNAFQALLGKQSSSTSIYWSALVLAMHMAYSHTMHAIYVAWSKTWESLAVATGTGTEPRDTSATAGRAGRSRARAPTVTPTSCDMELASPVPVIVHLADEPCAGGTCAAAEDASRAATAPCARVLLNTLVIVRVLYRSRGAIVPAPGLTIYSSI